MEAKHTPGPWTTDAKFEPYQPAPTVYAHGSKIADVRSSVCFTAEDVANARLIAAAPELLEALKACLRDNESKEPIHPRSRYVLSMATVQLAKEAIAKATA